ncbi:MAG: hypothetical protein NZ526_04970 [Aquificaceae bacterium]|nr:hypothetical protein [Aquificaceae bacterium]MCS7307886.1 hypothetical protein [Aquificaceae bacterium]MDW8095564.1 hypothetical protein [Aquificaceae bacterium]MDW8434247.1 hypothetical protein [Aquificaceae bacterium]
MSELNRKLDTDYVYFAEVELLLNYGVGYPDIIVKLREKVYQEKLEDSLYVRKADRKLFQNVHRFLELMENSDEPLEDDDSQPIEKWWWHLHKIAKGRYPSLMLKEYLRDVYRKRRKYWRYRERSLESHRGAYPAG